MNKNAPLIPPDGEPIRFEAPHLRVPDRPIIPYIEGDGIGADLWLAVFPVIDQAVKLAYGDRRRLCWMEVPAGEKALQQSGTLLPGESLAAFEQFRVGIKGPLGTPVGGGFRSLNVTLRRELDLYVCMRPVRWLPGVPTPVREPQLVDMVVFRENTEDLYAGIEFAAGSEINADFQQWLKERHPQEFARMRFPESAGIGIKPISREGSQRLVKAAVRYALREKRQRVTLIHKGNIMKYTEGAFAQWGYALAEEEFGSQVFTRQEWQARSKKDGEEAANQAYAHAMAQGKLYINDVITDAAFEQTLTRPQDFDVLATTNLNGDLLSDALMAQVGGLGIAPGANLNEERGVAIFEATHGTAPLLAGKNQANPCSLLLSSEMMLRHLGWQEAAELVTRGIGGAVAAKTVTFDFERLMPGARLLSTTQFGEAVVAHMRTAADDRESTE